VNLADTYYKPRLRSGARTSREASSPLLAPEFPGSGEQRQPAIGLPSL
jgi:hypothetical protein